MKRAALLLALVLVLGCPATDTAGRGTAPPALAAGQRYRFEQASAESSEQVFEVIAVAADVVLYRVQTTIQGKAVAESGAPLLMRFLRPQAKDPAVTGQQDQVLDGDGREPGELDGDLVPLVVGGWSFACRVSEVGPLKIYTAVEGGAPVFPGVVKITQGEDVCYRLVAVETKP